MSKERNSKKNGASRREALQIGGLGALGALVIGKAGPFISKAEAATPTLRLLMWQPYAIKETIEAFETKFNAQVRADLLRRQLRSLQQAEGRRHQGFRHGHGGRILAAALFPPGPDQGRRLRQDPEYQRRVSRFPARPLQAAGRRRRQEQCRGAQLLGRLWHHRQHRSRSPRRTSARSSFC